MKDGSETTSTAASTITETVKDTDGPPALVTLKEDKINKSAPAAMNGFLAYLESLEESKENMKEEKEEEEEEKKPAATTMTSSDQTTNGTASGFLPVGSVPSVAGFLGVAPMPAVASMHSVPGDNGMSSTSVASTVTAASSFTTPTKKGGVFEIRRFCAKGAGGGGSGGSGTMATSTPTRRTPTLEVAYWQIGFTVVAICNLLNERGKENYAWKPFLVNRVITGASEGDDEDWNNFNFTPSITGVSLVEKRKEAHGPNEAILGWNDYPQLFLSFTFMSNPNFEDTRAKVEEFGNKLLEFLRYPAFPPYYIGEVDNTFTSKKLRDSLMKTDHELWKMIQKAKLRIAEEESLDSFFMDDTIMKLVPGEIKARPSIEWPEAVVRKLYRSGQLPDHETIEL